MAKTPVVGGAPTVQIDMAQVLTLISVLTPLVISILTNVQGKTGPALAAAIVRSLKGVLPALETILNKDLANDDAVNAAIEAIAKAVETVQEAAPKVP